MIALLSRTSGPRPDQRCAHLRPIAKQHLLRKDGNWYALPIEASDLHLLRTFKDRERAEAFCTKQIEADCHCRIYEIVWKDVKQSQFI